MLLARARWALAEEADEKQRAREKQDLAFYDDEQWPADVIASRTGNQPVGTLVNTPARPTITINKVRQPVQYILNEERQADMGPELIPADDFTDDTPPVSKQEIDLREGLLRRIQRQSQAADARSWAFKRAVISGRGYYLVTTKYVDGPSFDQEVVVERIYNQASVLLDPSHEQPDGSDAEWEFWGRDYSVEQYRAEFGTRKSGKKNPVAIDFSTSEHDNEWRALMDEAPGWFREEGQSKVRYIRVVNYCYATYEDEEIVQLVTGEIVPAKDVPDLTDEMIATDMDGNPLRRRVQNKRIKWAKIDGSTDEPLGETDWPSPFMPIVKVTGEEVSPYDDQRRAIGVVRPSIGSQRGFNAMVSKQVEVVAYQPSTPFLVAEGQYEGYEQWYAAAANRILPYLPYRLYDDQGRQYPTPPQRQVVDAPIQAIAASVAMFSQAIAETTNVPEPALGNIQPGTMKSGKMLQAVLQQAQHGTSHFMDNLKRSIEYEAKLENSLLFPIYGRPGRLVKIITGQRQAENAHIVAPGQPMPPRQDSQGKAIKQYELSPDANFNIAIKVSKTYDTQRQELVAMLGEIVAANPQEMAISGDVLFENMDMPGAQELAKRHKAMLAPPIQQMLGSETPIPPQVQAQMQQLQQALQVTTAHVNDLTEQIKTKQVETQADLQKAQMDNATKLEIAKITAGANIAIADLKAQVQTALDTAKVAAEQVRSLVDAAEESRLARLQHEHSKELELLGHGHTLMEAQQAHAHQLAQGQQAAALAPPPTNGQPEGE